jgi:hypothetical protein
MKKMLLTFSGTNEELHKWLKVWCAENDKSMNGTVIGLIKKQKQKYDQRHHQANG